MTLRSSLVLALEGATSTRVLFVQKEPKDPVPCMVCRIIGDMPLLDVQGNDTGMSRARIQLTSIDDDYSGLEALVTATETELFANHTDFLAVIPLETKIEDKEDNLYYSIREYLIWYRK